jgi:hypothetical protein
MPTAFQSGCEGRDGLLRSRILAVDNRNVMVSFSGGGGGAALGSPAGILTLLVIIAIAGAVYWLLNR